MAKAAAKILEGNTRDQVDFAVDRGLNKREIIAVLNEVIKDVREAEDIPA